LHRKKAESKSLSSQGENIKFPSRIKLDVGGTRFTTSLSTLTQVGGTLFSGMFSGYFKIEPDKEGYYFFDRDPSVFPHILNFLRGTPLDVKTITKKELISLRAESIYYQLDELVAFLDKRPKFEMVWVKKGPCASKFTVGPDGKTLNCSSGWSTCQLGETPIPDSGTFECTLSWNVGHELMFGIAKESWPFADNVYPGTGYYGVTTNDNSTVLYQSWTASDRLKTVVDMDAKEIKFFLNGTETGSKSFSNWTGPLIFVACMINSSVQLRVES